jgi:hypothetical protein
MSLEKGTLDEFLFFCTKKLILFNILIIKYFLQITYLVVYKGLLYVIVYILCGLIDKKNRFL